MSGMSDMSLMSLVSWYVGYVPYVGYAPYVPYVRFTPYACAGHMCPFRPDVWRWYGSVPCLGLGPDMGPVPASVRLCTVAPGVSGLTLTYLAG